MCTARCRWSQLTWPARSQQRTNFGLESAKPKWHRGHYLPLVGPDLKLWFKYDSDLAPLRSHPRYQGLLALAGLAPASDT